MEPGSRAREVAHVVAILDRAVGLARAVAARDGGGDGGRALVRRRLAPDMFSFSEQAVVLSDGLVGALALLAGRPDDPRAAFVFNRGHGTDLGPLPDTAVAVAALFEAARRDAGPLSEAASAQWPAEIRVARPGDERLFDPADFLSRYVVPNGEFHLAMIHAVARSAGIPVGKRDFEGPPCWRRPGGRYRLQ